MHFRELNTRFRAILDSGIATELVSAPGRGKSQFIADQIKRQSAKDNKEWGFAKLFLATMTPPDLIGYQFKGERQFSDGNGGTNRVAVTEPTLPMWMVTEKGNPVWDYERGILFLDEYGQGEADVKRASAELLLNGQLGPWKLPKGWSVVAASNRSMDRSGVTKSFDFVINRRLEVEITDDLASWEQWAIENNIPPEFIAFAVQNPNIVFAPGVPDKQGPWCTPRSLVMAAQLLDGFRNDKGELPVDAGAVEIAAGMVGQAATAQMMAMIKLGLEMPKFEDIIDDPENTKLPDKPDAQMLVTYSLSARTEKSNATPIITYMQRFPKEFGITYAKSAVRRDAQLIFTPAFEKWANKNASLMAALVDQKSQ